MCTWLVRGSFPDSTVCRRRSVVRHVQATFVPSHPLEQCTMGWLCAYVFVFVFAGCIGECRRVFVFGMCAFVCPCVAACGGVWLSLCLYVWMTIRCVGLYGCVGVRVDGFVWGVLA